MARSKSLYKNAGLTPAQIANRDLAMQDFRAFVPLVAPYLHLAHCHFDMMHFLMEEKKHQLVIWPRGHMKSRILALWAAWWVVKNPETTILYASATAALAEKQLGYIKEVLNSPIVSKYWPELLDIDEGRRTMWRSDAIKVDHWYTKEQAIADPTIKAVGMGANVTGFHADVVLLDDLVVLDNAETKTEREKVQTWYSLASSILNPGGIIKAAGTRYHPDDLYNDLMTMAEPIFDSETGEIVGEEPIFMYTMKVVEKDGQFLWPRAKRPDGKWFGFDQKELGRIKASYLNKAQFWAQYYNDPSDPTQSRIANFEYYDTSILRPAERTWFAGSRRLNVYASIDFAATISKKSDYTAIAVIGIDEEHNVFVLDLVRLKTDKISEMQQTLSRLYDKWGWLKLRAEATAAQNLVIEFIKEQNRKHNLFYQIEKTTPSTEKRLRIMSVLEPRYAAGKVFHFRGGNCEVLEHELRSTKPAHDDVSDALASAVEIAVAPVKSYMQPKKVSNIGCHPRFGGVR